MGVYELGVPSQDRQTGLGVPRQTELGASLQDQQAGQNVGSLRRTELGIPPFWAFEEDKHIDNVHGRHNRSIRHFLCGKHAVSL